MAETLIKEEVCGACQADVRPGSLFCYHCGASVSDEVVKEPEDVLPENEIVDEPEAEIEESDAEIVGQNEPPEETVSEKITFFVDGEKSADVIEEPAEVVDEQEDVKPSKKDEPKKPKKPKLRSAASLRKRRNIKTKEVKITWEEYENAPNGLFIAIAILLTIFVVGIVFVAMYLQ